MPDLVIDALLSHVCLSPHAKYHTQMIGPGCVKRRLYKNKSPVQRDSPIAPLNLLCRMTVYLKRWDRMALLDGEASI